MNTLLVCQPARSNVNTTNNLDLIIFFSRKMGFFLLFSLLSAPFLKMYFFNIYFLKILVYTAFNVFILANEHLGIVILKVGTTSLKSWSIMLPSACIFICVEAAEEICFNVEDAFQNKTGAGQKKIDPCVTTSTLLHPTQRTSKPFTATVICISNTTHASSLHEICTCILTFASSPNAC